LENIQREAWHKCNILIKTAWAWLNSDYSNKTSIWELRIIVPKKKQSSPCTQSLMLLDSVHGIHFTVVFWLRLVAIYS
jgi:hypothetical protein